MCIRDRLKTIHEIHEIPIQEDFLWTDSRIVMCWLKADGKQFLQFVSHRIGEIQEATDIADWHWISTKENVADEATKDNLDCDLHANSRWLNGPKFLKEPEHTWILDGLRKRAEVVDPSLLDLKKNRILLVTGKLTHPRGDIARFSSWTRLIRSTAYFLRFVKIWTKKENFPSQLTVTELKQAENCWWAWSQEESYTMEYQSLMDNQEIGE